MKQYLLITEVMAWDHAGLFLFNTPHSNNLLPLQLDLIN